MYDNHHHDDEQPPTAVSVELSPPDVEYQADPVPPLYQQRHIKILFATICFPLVVIASIATGVAFSTRGSSSGGTFTVDAMMIVWATQQLTKSLLLNTLQTHHQQASNQQI